MKRNHTFHPSDSVTLSDGISVIIPVYNGEKYVAECLESVLAQTYPNVEIVVVNDGSTDSSLRILQGLQRRRNEFHIITTENGGLSHARNVGIENSTGKYLFFLDCDDTIHPDTLKLLLEASQSFDADITAADFRRKDRLQKDLHSRISLIEYDVDSALADSMYQIEHLSTACGKLYSRRIFENDILFRKGILYEDLDSFYRFFDRSNRVVFVKESLYFYRRTPGSILHLWNPARLDVLDVTDRMVEYMRMRHPRLVKAAEDRRFSAHYNMLLLMMAYKVENPPAIDRCWKVIRKGRLQAILDPNVRLKNKLGALLSYGGTSVLKLFAKKYR